MASAKRQKINSLTSTTSRYTQGGKTVKFADRMGWWERRNIPPHDTDVYVEITPRYHKRPWMMAHDYFGDPQLDWVILQINAVLDISEDFVTGKVMRVPSKQRLLYEILSVPVTL